MINLLFAIVPASFAAVVTIYFAVEKYRKEIAEAENYPVLDFYPIIESKQGKDFTGMHTVTYYDYKIGFVLENKGKSSLRDIVVYIEDRYRDPDTNTIQPHVPGYFSFETFEKTDGINYYRTIDVKLLPVGAKKQTYMTHLASVVGSFSYNIVIEWSNGSIRRKVEFIPVTKASSIYNGRILI